MFKCKPDLVTPETFVADNFSKTVPTAIQFRAHVPIQLMHTGSAPLSCLLSSVLPALLAYHRVQNHSADAHLYLFTVALEKDS